MKRAQPVIVSVASLKHWPDPQKGLHECLRVLRPGGHLVIIEGDRGALLEDVRFFLSNTRLPRPVQPLLLPLFRTFVFGHCPDLEDLRALAALLPLASPRVERIPRPPALLLSGQRA